MFQNITESIDHKGKNDKQKAEAYSKNRLLLIQNIAVYIIAFLVSIIGIKGEVAPFAMAMFVACCNSNVPAGVILIITIIGNFIGFGIGSTISYILTVLVFMFSIIVFKPVIQDNRNEITRLGKNLIISTAIVQAIRCIFKSDLFVYDVLLSISYVVLTYVFYKIFVNSISVIKNFNKDKAFSIEELIGASILVTIASSIFGQFSFFGIEIPFLIAIFLILVLSLRNGILVGGTTGISVGLILGVMGICNPFEVLAFAIAGLIAGILSRFGKIPTIIGFIIGDVLVTYIANGFAVELISIKEILVASIGLIFVPKFSGIDIADSSEYTPLLTVPIEKRLSDGTEAKEKLNSISSVLSEMAKILGLSDTKELENDLENIDNNKRMFIEDLLDNMERFPNNILYDDIINLDTGIVEDIYLKVVEKSEIEYSDLIDVFENHNNYIVGTENNDVIREDIDQIVRVINRTYRINEMGFNWKSKFEDKKKTISKQLTGVSKAISNVAENLVTEKPTKGLGKKEKEIIELLSQKQISVNDIKIKKSKYGKLFVDIYFENVAIVKEKDKIKCIENIISKVCDEKVAIQKDTSNIDASSYMQRYSSEDKYVIQIGYSKASKSGNAVSGDSSLQVKLDDDKYLVLLSDGMGSGSEARKSSQIVIKMMKKLLAAGFDREDSLELINSTIKLTTEEVYATIDASIFDLYNGNVEFIKNGACKTYIKNKQNISQVASNALPLGILNKVEMSVFDRDVVDGDIYVICSDGIVDSKQEEDNDKWLIKLLKNISTNNVQKMADILIKEAIDNNYGICKDDMTIFTVKVTKKTKN